MERITQAQLNYAVERINVNTKSPLTPYTKVDGRLVANIGNFHIYGAYGGYGLHRMCNEGGGITQIIGISTKRELYNQLQAMINGIHYATH
jgi:hypothetical protein